MKGKIENKIKIGNNESDLKEGTKKIQVTEIKDPENPSNIGYAFSIYGWSYPSLWDNDGIAKRGVTRELTNPGIRRASEATSGSKTAVPQPYVIVDDAITKYIPEEIHMGDIVKADKFARNFDRDLKRIISKYSTTVKGLPKPGEEWYKLGNIEFRKIVFDLWEKTVKQESEMAYKNIISQNSSLKKISLRPGMQKEAFQSLLYFFSEKISRGKGKGPTGMGKTVIMSEFLTHLHKNKMISNRISVVMAPTRFLAFQNCCEFRIFNNINKISGIYNESIFSGNDMGIKESEEGAETRKDILKSIISGHLREKESQIILHVCYNSMLLMFSILKEIGINFLEIVIADEGHNLVSTGDHKKRGHRGTIRNCAWFEENFDIRRRYSLSASETNLEDPQNLKEEEFFGYMNNPDFFGPWIYHYKNKKKIEFNYNYADGVDQGYIAPFTFSLLAFSKEDPSIKKFLEDPSIQLLLRDVKVKSSDGGFEPLDLSGVKLLIVFLKKIAEGKKKILMHFQYNDNARLIRDCLVYLKNNGNKMFKDVHINDILAEDFTPTERDNELKIIDKSEDRHIILCGPWALEGLNCPSIDSITWSYFPRTNRKIEQGNGRGSRIIPGIKETYDICIPFDLDEEGAQNRIIEVTSMQYNRMFVTDNIEVGKRLRKKYGSKFLKVESTSTVKDGIEREYKDAQAFLKDFERAANSENYIEWVAKNTKNKSGKIKKIIAIFGYGEDDLKKILPKIILKHGIFNWSQIYRLSKIEGDTRLVVPHSVFKDFVNDEIEKNRHRMASMSQCYDLIKVKEIKSPKKWKEVIQQVNSEKLVYPYDPAEYFLGHNKKSTSDSYAVKEGILIASDKSDHYKKYIIGNLEDHQKLICSRSLKSNQVDKSGWETLENKPYWACGAHPAQHFQISVDVLFTGMEDLLAKGSPKTDSKLNQLREMFPDCVKIFKHSNSFLYKTATGELISHNDLSKKIGATRSTLTTYLNLIKNEQSRITPTSPQSSGRGVRREPQQL